MYLGSGDTRGTPPGPGLGTPLPSQVGAGGGPSVLIRFTQHCPVERTPVDALVAVRQTVWEMAPNVGAQSKWSGAVVPVRSAASERDVVEILIVSFGAVDEAVI